MIRQPTPLAVAYAWHTAALAGHEPVTSDEPQAGYFKRRLVKGGPFVPCRIWLDQPVDLDTGELIDDEQLLCEVNGAWADATEQWSWICGNPISEAEFRYMEALRLHTVRHEPDHPAASPRQPIDHLTTPLHF